MSKQKKTLGKSPQTEAAWGRDEEVEVDPAIAEAAMLGNAALMDQTELGNSVMRDLLGHEASQSADRTPYADMAPVRRSAFSLVEQAVLALQTLPADHARISRFVDILSQSAGATQHHCQPTNHDELDLGAAKNLDGLPKFHPMTIL